ncbi:MAG TPA: tRNA epoxyqueuosine(34) reductase QueG [Pirellulaceae bacterium]|jgi:epoxyqueuosine reductase|nr:tRNA epoxyqueuosine(34) reductase QueG [Pirellulaceae bacterium]
MSLPLASTDLATLKSELRERAAELGFTSFGVAPAVIAPGFDRFERWLDAGFAGEMEYLPRRREAYRHPDSVLAGARSVVMLGLPYRDAEGAADPARPGEGRIASYAWGTGDYHDLIRERLDELGKTLADRAPGASVRGVVDTAPLLERDFARLAGLGWQAKNTLLIDKRQGSYLFLAALLTDLELPPDEPHVAQHCGTCTACLDACPTGAFPEPRVLDATKCISYLTIELKGPIPETHRTAIGEWIFGCDVCQEVCPWNRKAPPSEEADFQRQAERERVDLVELLSLDEAAFRQRFRGTPMKRAKRRGLLRNAAIALGNNPRPDGAGALIRSLDDVEPLIREAAAWALRFYAGEETVATLGRRLGEEREDWVAMTIRNSLAIVEGAGPMISAPSGDSRPPLA